jgi:hypothetical protein
MPPIAPAPTTQTFIINLTESGGEKTAAFYVKDRRGVHEVSHIVRINFRIDAYGILIQGITRRPAFAESQFNFEQSCVRLRALRATAGTYHHDALDTLSLEQQ